MLVPTLVISGNSGIDEKITELGAGADGYLTKPCDRYELMANLDAIMRCSHGHGSATISVGNLIVDLRWNYAKVVKKRLDLTAKEFRIIEFLAFRKGAVLSKGAFLNHLYGGIDEPEQKSSMCSFASFVASWSIMAPTASTSIQSGDKATH